MLIWLRYGKAEGVYQFFGTNAFANSRIFFVPQHLQISFQNRIEDSWSTCLLDHDSKTEDIFHRNQRSLLRFFFQMFRTFRFSLQNHSVRRQFLLQLFTSSFSRRPWTRKASEVTSVKQRQEVFSFRLGIEAVFRWKERWCKVWIISVCWSLSYLEKWFDYSTISVWTRRNSLLGSKVRHNIERCWHQCQSRDNQSSAKHNCKHNDDHHHNHYNVGWTFGGRCRYHHDRPPLDHGEHDMDIFKWNSCSCCEGGGFAGHVSNTWRISKFITCPGLRFLEFLRYLYYCDCECFAPFWFVAKSIFCRVKRTRFVYVENEII